MGGTKKCPPSRGHFVPLNVPVSRQRVSQVIRRPRWTPPDLQRLRVLRAAGYPLKTIARLLDRTPQAIANQAWRVRAKRASAQHPRKLCAAPTIG